MRRAGDYWGDGGGSEMGNCCEWKEWDGMGLLPKMRELGGWNYWDGGGGRVNPKLAKIIEIVRMGRGGRIQDQAVPGDGRPSRKFPPPFRLPPPLLLRWTLCCCVAETMDGHEERNEAKKKKKVTKKTVVNSVDMVGRCAIG